MTRDDTEIVSALRTALADRVGKDRFDLWFGPCSRLRWDGKTLRIAVPNPLFKDWLNTHFRAQIEAACQSTLGCRPAVEFHVDQSCPPAEAQPNPPETPAEPSRLRTGLSAAASGRPEQPARAGAAREPGLLRRRFADLESFVVGPCNRLAQAAAELVARRPGEMSPLTVYGPTGVGKTHLLEGIWTATRKNRRDLTAVYLSAEQFTTLFLQALRGSGLPAFRQKYRGVDLLILDDLQFFCGKRHTQVELLYTIDTLLREGRQVVCAADRAPSELGELGPELLSRLQSGMVCPIEPPDLQTRLGILARMAQRMELRVPADVLHFIATHFTQHARQLSGALCRLGATSQALGVPITLPMAEEALAEMIRQHTRVVRLRDIEKAVCQTFGLEPGSLQSGRKDQSVSHPRMLAMWLARKYTRSALAEIGQYFGRRSHTTVLSAQKRVDQWLAAGKSLSVAEQPCTVQEAIHQLERRLQAG